MEVLVEAHAGTGARDAAARARQHGARVLEVAPGVLESAAATVTPNGVAAIARRPEVDRAGALAAARRAGLALVLVDVADPGNAGTLLRAAESAGAGAVLFCGGSVDPCNPKCVRASAGAVFHVPVTNGGEAVEVLEAVADAGLRRVATTAHGATPYDRVDLTGPVAIVLGNEARGLPAEVLEAVELTVSIPTVGRTESLNVAMAGSVLCLEALRQRRAREAT
jgi:TrmH family RNA methyltransferase